MKKLTLLFATMLLATGVGLSATAREGHDKGARVSARNADETSVVGYISDSRCGLKHMDGMGDDKSCTLTCVKGGSKFVLADQDHRVVYALDRAGQEKAREFAGQKVKVTGRVTGKTIHVNKIETA